jgi:hypothetical protein
MSISYKDGIWDFNHSDPNKTILNICEIFNKDLRILGYDLFKTPGMAAKFLYDWRRNGEKRHIYFIFIIYRDDIINIAHCHKRKDINQIISKFSVYKMIVFYPVSDICRYYVPNFLFAHMFNSPIQVSYDYFKTHSMIFNIQGQREARNSILTKSIRISKEAKKSEIIKIPKETENGIGLDSSVLDYSNIAEQHKSKTCYVMNSELFLKLRINWKRSGKTRINYLTFENIDESIETYFKNHKSKYSYFRNEQFCLNIFNKETYNQVQLSIEPKIYSLILYPISKCQEKTLENIYLELKEFIEFKSAIVILNKIDQDKVQYIKLN